MNSKFKRGLKITVLLTSWVFIIRAVWTVTILMDLFGGIQKRTLGEFLWGLIYLGTPIITALVPLAFKYIKKYSWRKTASTMFFSLAAYILIIYITHTSIFTYASNFSTEKWLTNRQDRHYMLDNLNRKHKIIGMDVSKLKALLGSPDIESEAEIEYLIGYGWIDPEMLVFKIENNKVFRTYKYVEFKPEEEMSNYVEKLMEKEQYPENIIVEIMSVLIDKHYKEGRPLSEAEQTIFLISIYEGEINNGGFDQFFFNGGNTNSFDGKFAQLTVEALNKINAVKNAELVQSAIDAVSDPKYGANTDEESESLNKLDNEFYAYPENLARLQLEYIKENINLFTK